MFSSFRPRTKPFGSSIFAAALLRCLLNLLLFFLPATARPSCSESDAHTRLNPWPAQTCFSMSADRDRGSGYPLVLLLHASFSPRLTMTPLRFANPSPPSGWVEDFHPQAIEHARQTGLAQGEPSPAIWCGSSKAVHGGWRRHALQC